LALLGRRPHQCVEGLVMPASEKPTQERPIEVAGEVGTSLIPAAVTLQGVGTLHAAMTVSFDRPSSLWEPWY